MTTLIERSRLNGAITLPGILLERAKETPNAVALRRKRLGRWQEDTWRDYAEKAAQVGVALLALGVKRGDRVAIHSDNRPEWVHADMGIQGIGAIAVGIYPTSPAREVGYLLSHSEAVVLIAENEEQLDKALEVRDQCPDLRRIVLMDTRGVRVLDDPMVMTYAQLLALGGDLARERLLDDFAIELAKAQPSDVALIVYTSGTTGPPKGAMLSHLNLLAAAESAAREFDVQPDDEILSYLPLCHIAERLVSVIDAVYRGYIVNFGEGIGTFAADLREVQPTFFLGVPRVWEKMLASVEIRMADASWLKRTLYRSWIARGRRLAHKRWEGSFSALDRVVYGIGWLLIYRSVRDKLGLRRTRQALSGAAPIAPQVLEFFWSLGIPVREAYGQTENTSMGTFMPVDRTRLGTVGVAAPGVELKIADDGEILTRSGGVFVGYFRNPKATAEAVDADGWLHTGDVGFMDDDGFVTITDRKKDIIITAGGKNISPSEIENALKISPYVREAIVIGDRRKHLSALIGIELETVGNWAARRNLAYTTYEDLSSKPEVRDLIAREVDKANEHFARVEGIKAFELLPVELDQDKGQLTATQKVKRKAIEKEFADLIEGMYR